MYLILQPLGPTAPTKAFLVGIPVLNSPPVEGKIPVGTAVFNNCFQGILGGEFPYETHHSSPSSPIPSMGLVYLPTFTLKINNLNVGKYTSPMDGM